MINIICVKWGTKYDTYVEKLKTQIENNCTLDYKFFCLTDNPKESYDIQLPTTWDHLYDPTRGKFWAYRKCYMFNEDLFSELDGDQFLYLDQDVLIHNNIDHLFDMDMSKPSIVRGWWNDINNCKKNFGKLKSTPLNSSMIRWNRGQMKPVFDHINKNKEYIFFTHSTIDNYFNHHWYDIYNEDKGFLKGFEKGIVYSWYKGNIFPEDMELNKLRYDHLLCLFNNSHSVRTGIVEEEHMHQIDEIRNLWNT